MILPRAIEHFRRAGFNPPFSFRAGAVARCKTAGGLKPALLLVLAALGLAGCARRDDDGGKLQDAPRALEQPAFCSEIPRPGWARYEKLAAGGPWFDVYRLDGDLYAIAEPRQWQEVISYLIVGESRALLFDSGNGIGDIKAVAEELTALPVTVLASHSHFDHVGGHWRFDDVLAPDTAFTDERAKGLPNEIVREEASAAALCAPLPDGVTEDNHHIKPFAPDARVGEGARIDLGGLALDVLAVPGHTPDSIALLDRGNGRLFTGDTYYKGPIWLFAPETDLSAYAASIARLADLAPSLKAVHGAHNEPFSAPDELIKVRDAFAAATAGKAKPQEVEDGRARYVFETFELLLQQDHEGRP